MNMTTQEFAKSLGAQIYTTGINWVWFSGFPTKEAAEKFLTHPEIGEHRGVYTDDVKGVGITYSVRIR